MFGLTKREQRWKAEQKAAETLLGLAKLREDNTTLLNQRTKISENLRFERELHAATQDRVKELDAELTKALVRITELELTLAKQRGKTCVALKERNDAMAELTTLREQVPAAIECGLDNGDGSYSVHIKRWPLPSYMTVNKDRPVKLLYAAPVAKPQLAAVMPCGAAVSNVYEAYAAGLAAKPQVVMPERATKNNTSASEVWCNGWNTCLDEVARLNAAEQEGDQDE
jgi:hypothetical protein